MREVWQDLTFINQAQIVQTEIGSCEVRVHSEQKLTKEQVDQLRYCFMNF